MIDDDPGGTRRPASGLWVPGESADGDEGAQPRDPASDGEADASTEPMTPEDELAKARAEAAENRDSWLRAAAELENFRRRAARDLTEGTARARADVLRSLLGVLDDVDRALAAAASGGHDPDAGDVDAAPLPSEDSSESPMVAGIRLIRGRLENVLRQFGVAEIEAGGSPFDPHEHEAVMQIESEEVAEGEVAQVFERGYRIGDRVLRPAKVAVAGTRTEEE